MRMIYCTKNEDSFFTSHVIISFWYDTWHSPLAAFKNAARIHLAGNTDYLGAFFFFFLPS